MRKASSFRQDTISCLFLIVSSEVWVRVIKLTGVVLVLAEPQRGKGHTNDFRRKTLEV
jgi:hypothetical protein